MNQLKLIKWLLVSVIVVMMTACGGGSGGDDVNSNPAGVISGGASDGDEGGNNNPPVMKTISGVVVDDPIIGATVKVLSLSSEELQVTTTDNNGSYSMQVKADDISAGFMLEATGGTMNGEDFNGTFRAIYGVGEDLAQANVTLITALVAKMTMEDNGTSGTLVEKRDAMLQKLSNIGMVKSDDWFKTEPSLVHMEHLRDLVGELGLEGWLNGISDDIIDSQLTIRHIKGFPEANGGIIAANIGQNKIITTYENDQFIKGIQLFLYDQNTSATYTYSLNNAPSGMTITDEGVLGYTVPSDINSNSQIDIQIIITNQTTMKSRIVPVTISILDSEVMASGVVGAAGGVIMNEWEDLVLTIPADAVDSDSEFKVLRFVDTDGSYVYRTISSQPLKKLLRLKIPPRVINQNDSTNRSINKGILESRDRERGTSWKHWKSWTANFLEIESISARVNASNRMRSDLTENPQHDNINISDKKVASSLYSLCDAVGFATGECKDRDPVLFIHGFATGLDVIFDDAIGANAGGGSGTWGKFPELIYNEGYSVFEFTWKTNSTFRDTAVDLSEAVRLIELFTHKKVNIIAHSFGGLLSRTYIQGLARNQSYQNNVQSLLTLSTPHSGIFDDDVTLNFEDGDSIRFLKGQHSFSFEGCLQSSCNQAGEASDRIYKVPSDLLAFNSIEVWDDIGIDKVQGSQVARLAKNFKDNGYEFPVPVKVLKGLTIDRANFFNACGLHSGSFDEQGNNFKDKIELGDQLIYHKGQSFYPGSTAGADEIFLGMPDGTKPGDILDFEHNFAVVPEYSKFCGVLVGTIQTIYKKRKFKGYRHSHSHAGQGAIGGFTTKGTEGIAYVAHKNNFSDTGKPHEALTETKQWLEDHPSRESFPLLIALDFTVISAGTGDAVPAKLDIKIDGVSKKSVQTNSDGKVSVELQFKPNAQYSVVAGSVSEEYKTDVFSGYQTAQHLGLSSRVFPKIKLQPNVVAKGLLEGTIIDAVTGNSISGVTITLSSTRNNSIQTTTTDSSGGYSFSDLIRGSYDVTATKEGYSESSFSFNVQPDQTNNGDGSLRAILGERQMSIRLSWDVDPRDLDSHLVKYDSAGNQLYHLYYSHKNDSTTGDNLDRDDTTSYGPETTTIESIDSSAKYVFAVYHYGGSGSITSTSNAKVEINYGGHVSIPTQSAPTSGEGRWWKAFEIVNGEVIPCVSDCILNDESTVFNRSLRQTMSPNWLTDIAAESKASK